MTGPRLRWGLLVVVVAVATVVVWRAFSPIPHSGGDNAAYVSLAHGILTTGTYTDVFDPAKLPHTKYPPLFPAVLALLIAVGARTWVALKLAAAVPTVLAVALTYLWAERRLGAWGGFAVALLLAVCAGVVYYSHWILSDPLFVALTLVGLYALSRVDEVWATPESESPQAPAGETTRTVWLSVGVLAVGLAYFTRSAGLPLVVTLFGWLALRSRWRALGASVAALGLPMIGWWLRGRGEGVGQYSTEFWLVDPYDPARGSVGVLGLVPRFVDNLSAYTLRHIPAGIVGTDGPALAALGIAVALVGLAGWALTARRRIGPAEIFFPLYAGLILLWPAVWGGDRFALPLFPLLLLYGAVAVGEVARRAPAVAGSAVSGIAVLALLLPASADWMEASRQNAACASVVRERGPWACYGPRIERFVEAASWTGAGLPEGSVVLTRKPRHFYLLSGHASRTFAFSDEPAAHLALADSVGARYVLLDQWDGLAGRYVGSAVRGTPEAYCFIRGFGQPAEGGAQLLGIRAAADRHAARAQDGVGRCSAEYLGSPAANDGYSPSGRIPLLVGLDS